MKTQTIRIDEETIKILKRIRKQIFKECNTTISYGDIVRGIIKKEAIKIKMSDDRTTIMIEMKTRDKLKERKKKGETYSDLIKRMLI